MDDLLSLPDIVVGLDGTEHTREELVVHEWQSEQLRRLGLCDTLAEMFAGTVDWHDLAALLARGCPLGLALEIVH